MCLARADGSVKQKNIARFQARRDAPGQRGGCLGRVEPECQVTGGHAANLQALP
jgi:hypothetical protein